MNDNHHLKQWIQHGIRRKVVDILSVIEDMLYILLAILFALSAIAVIIDFLSNLQIHSYTSFIEASLDHFLIVFMLIELMHTTLLYLRTHRFRHEPFLMVGMIAGIRSLLILSADQTVEIHQGELFYILKLAVTAIVILVLAISLKISHSSAKKSD